MNDTDMVDFRDAESDDAAWMAAALTDEGYPAGASDLAGRLDRFAPPGSAVRVAERGGVRLGFVACHLLPRLEREGPVLRIIALIVDPGARERGVGAALLEEVERIARAAGAGYIETTSGHHRPEATRLFRHAGFESTLTTYLRKHL
ncbi:MAG: GNAT family N-acetyltransferase [Chloroflexi bacterium]|nr:GNAT family N-acetyltransferase [Chloroflexota bacterium]